MSTFIRQKTVTEIVTDRQTDIHNEKQTQNNNLTANVNSKKHLYNVSTASPVFKKFCIITVIRQ